MHYLSKIVKASIQVQTFLQLKISILFSVNIKVDASSRVGRVAVVLKAMMFWSDPEGTAAVNQSFRPNVNKPIDQA